MNKEEKQAIEYFEHKIKNKLPLYEETYVDGKPYRRNILQLETNFTEEQANKTKILLNLIDKLQKENEELSQSNFSLLKINQKLIEEKPMIKELTGKELNLLEEIDKLKKENEDMREELQMYVDTPISKLKEENKYLRERLEFRVNYCNELEHELYEEGNYIHKAAIRKFIKEELPDDEIMETCEMFDINGVYLRKKLEELLGE